MPPFVLCQYTWTSITEWKLLVKNVAWDRMVIFMACVIYASKMRGASPCFRALLWHLENSAVCNLLVLWPSQGDWSQVKSVFHAFLSDMFDTYYEMIQSVEYKVAVHTNQTCYAFRLHNSLFENTLSDIKKKTRKQAATKIVFSLLLK